MTYSKGRLLTALSAIGLLATVSLANAEPNADMILQQQAATATATSANSVIPHSEYTSSLRAKSANAKAPESQAKCSTSPFDKNTEVACDTPHGGQ